MTPCRLFLLLLGPVAMALASCAARPPDPPEDLLAPYESGAWPAAFGALDLDPARNYFILAQVPAPVAYELTSPETARAALARLVRQPWRLFRAGTFYGHVLAGWSCADGRHGLVGKTGADESLFFRMLGAGWGVGAALATYEGAHLVALDEIEPGHLAILAEGRGHLLAAEIDAGQCAALRDGVERYITAPGAPATRFSLTADAADLEGDICISFALWVAAQADLLTEVAPHLTRRIPLNAAFVGTGITVPDGVTPLAVTAADGSLPPPIRLGDLLERPWDGGSDLGRRDIIDAELLFAGLTALRGAAGLPPGWHERRAMAPGAPAVAEARRAMLDWARVWPRWRITWRGPAAAIILERAGPPTSQ